MIILQKKCENCFLDLYAVVSLNIIVTIMHVRNCTGIEE